jgi:TRAP-type mannitol/chloroaromatic compound transport system substrate-binding protein
MTEPKSGPVSRRSFLKRGALAGGAAAAAGTLAAPAVLAQSPMVIRMQSSWPSSDIFHEMAQQYVDRVNAMAGGRLQVELLPAGAVVGAFQIQDAVADGVLDAGHHVTAYWYGKTKAASLFGTGPVFGIDGAQILAWIHYGGGKDLYRELVQDILGLPVVGFFAMPMPTQPLGWFETPPASVDDMKGLKYRTVGLSADVNQALGLAVTQLPGGEIIPAMERGVIDAFEFNNPTSDRRFGAQDVVSDYMLGSYHQAAETFEIIFNQPFFESLDPDLQAILEFAAEAANTANYGLAMENYSADLQALVNEDGVTVHRTPDSIMQAQLEAWDQVVAGLMEDDIFRRIIESQKAWGERVGFYSLTNSANYRAAYDHYFPNKLTF